MTAVIKRCINQTTKSTGRLFDFLDSKREIRFTKKEYVSSELLKCKGNTNSILKIINHCLPNREPPLTAVEDPVVQANRFNDFYVSVKEAAAAKAKALCEQYGFSEESISQASVVNYRRSPECE